MSNSSNYIVSASAEKFCFNVKPIMDGLPLSIVQSNIKDGIISVVISTTKDVADILLDAGFCICES